MSEAKELLTLLKDMSDEDFDALLDFVDHLKRGDDQKSISMVHERVKGGKAS